MSGPSDDLCTRYGDILGEDEGFAVLRTLHDLDRAFTEAPLHPRLHTPPTARQPRASGEWSHHRRPWRRTGPLLIVVALLLLGVTAVLAAQGIFNLGKPTETYSTNPYFPLSGFRRVSVSLHQGKKPELLFLAVQGELEGEFDHIAMERWPLVKALEQFGVLTGVKAVGGQCPGPAGGPGSPCNMATFDLSHAHYSSLYLAFVNRDMIRITPPRAAVYQRLAPVEQQIFTRYALVRKPVCYRRDSHGNLIAGRRGQLKIRKCSTFADLVWATVDNTTDLHTLPLIAIGGYLQTISQDMTQSDFYHTTIVTTTPGITGAYQTTYPFATVQSALLTGKDPGNTSHVVEDVNAEANIITALICHAEGGKPDSVCGRPVIKQILTHVR
jgi:hypothetical protein